MSVICEMPVGRKDSRMMSKYSSDSQGARAPVRNQNVKQQSPANSTANIESITTARIRYLAVVRDQTSMTGI
ncbi:MAG: hypothetical protein IPK83_14515 [Planctomycetes bacterium]|nr:hypothetical protein [Planctomycetota bacterium]